MRDLTVEKARELRQALLDTHLPAPVLEDILADLGRAGHNGSPGKVCHMYLTHTSAFSSMFLNPW